MQQWGLHVHPPGRQLHWWVAMNGSTSTGEGGLKKPDSTETTHDLCSTLQALQSVWVPRGTDQRARG